MINYSEYNYKELVEQYRQEPTKENLNELALWFQHYGWRFWNGEYYECKELSGEIYPIYQEINDDEFELIGWELK